jgi:hypothetical protein
MVGMSAGAEDSDGFVGYADVDVEPIVTVDYNALVEHAYNMDVPGRGSVADYVAQHGADDAVTMRLESALYKTGCPQSEGLDAAIATYVSNLQGFSDLEEAFFGEGVRLLETELTEQATQIGYQKDTNGRAIRNMAYGAIAGIALGMGLAGVLGFDTKDILPEATNTAIQDVMQTYGE